jgi:hypothetical protein
MVLPDAGRRFGDGFAAAREMVAAASSGRWFWTSHDGFALIQAKPSPPPLEGS